MNPLIQRTTIELLLIGLTLACFGLVPQTQAIVPGPDGCYPNFTTAEGCDALSLLTTGAGNTGLGWRSLFFNSSGSFNTGVGGGALALNNGDSNTAVGAAALLLNTTGTLNTAVGIDALVNNDTGSRNTAIGDEALLGQTGGDLNTAVGEEALRNLNNGSGNIAVGAGAGSGVTQADHVICIGASGANTSNGCYIGQIFGATSSGGTAVFVNSNGRLGTMTSSARFKEGIKPMGAASEAILALRPVSFCYKKNIDPQQRPQFGLVAEDVEKVDTSLIVRGEDGKPYSVRYDAVNVMLLNEFLKEHSKNDAQEKTIAELKSEMTALIATVKEQAAQIQKVSAQLAGVSSSDGGLEASERAPQVVNNP